MFHWIARFTAASSLLLWLIAAGAGVSSRLFRGSFWTVLALWQGAATVVVYCHDGVKSRKDCIGAALAFQFAVVAYLIWRYPTAWPLFALGTPFAAALSALGAWWAWRTAVTHHAKGGSPRKR